MDEHLVDLIILLPGNYVPVVSTRAAITEYEQMLNQDVCDANKGKWLTLTDKDGYIRKITVGAILGWYTRPHEISAAQEQLKLLKKVVKDATVDESWKSSDD